MDGRALPGARASPRSPTRAPRARSCPDGAPRARGLANLEVLTADMNGFDAGGPASTGWSRWRCSSTCATGPSSSAAWPAGWRRAGGSSSTSSPTARFAYPFEVDGDGRLDGPPLLHRRDDAGARPPRSRAGPAGGGGALARPRHALRPDGRGVARPARRAPRRRPGGAAPRPPRRRGPAASSTGGASSSSPAPSSSGSAAARSGWSRTTASAPGRRRAVKIAIVGSGVSGLVSRAPPRAPPRRGAARGRRPHRRARAHGRPWPTAPGAPSPSTPASSSSTAGPTRASPGSSRAWAWTPRRAT